MTGYRHFKISDGVPANANVAKVANDQSAEDQTLATLATLALAAAQTTKTGGQPELEPKPDPAELEERKGIASGVPERYVDAWARFQSQCPGGVTEQAWCQAVEDAGRFLAQWGKLADSFGWSPGDLSRRLPARRAKLEPQERGPDDDLAEARTSLHVGNNANSRRLNSGSTSSSLR
jgi:hypothetical protein